MTIGTKNHKIGQNAINHTFFRIHLVLYVQEVVINFI